MDEHQRHARAAGTTPLSGGARVVIAIALVVIVGLFGYIGVMVGPTLFSPTPVPYEQGDQARIDRAVKNCVAASNEGIYIPECYGESSAPPDGGEGQGIQPYDP